MIYPGSRLRSAYYDRTREERRKREAESVRLPQHVPQPVPHVEHPPARADGQQHGDDGEGV